MGGSSGTVTFLFTDIEGSTGLWQLDEPAMRAAMARHDDLLQSTIAAHGGRVFSTMGDGVAAAFASAGAALAAARDAQRGLQAETWGTAHPLNVRMGLHSGEAEERDGDYFGPAVNRASRMMSAAHGGQVLVSGATAALVADGLPADCQLVALGEHRLRDLGRPELLHALRHPDLPSDFPPPRTLDAFPGNLPLQVSSFIGRQREFARVVGVLNEGRVVTLTGVGGVGKTRLALQVAAEVLPGFADGAWLAELGPVRDPQGVAAACASALSAGSLPDPVTAGALAAFLHAKELLLVLDNCEHLLGAVADLVSLLERSCPRIRVLATSREGLAIEGEQLVPVPSMPAPPAEADLSTASATDAVRLFVERARSSDPDFVLDPTNLEPVVQICQRLDGVPLALELAAARITMMTPVELARGLDRRFETLAGGRRGAVQRHQTLRAAINWSYEMLTEGERRVLARLSVFVGGCIREAAETVCSDEAIGPSEVFEAMTGLVAKSLVVAQRDGPQTRYRLLETIREYAEERLAERGETDEVRDRHLAFYQELATTLRLEFGGPEQRAAGFLLLGERDNLVAALGHAVDGADAGGALRLLTAGLQETGYTGSVWSATRSVSGSAAFSLPGAAEHPLYPFALLVAAQNAAMSGELETARSLLDEADARSPEDPSPRARLIRAEARGALAFASGHPAAAAEHYLQAASETKGSGEDGRVSWELGSAAMFLVMADQLERAEGLAREGAMLARRSGSPGNLALNLTALAGSLAERDPPRARLEFVEALRVWGEGTEFTAPGQAVFIAARLDDWDAALRLAAPAVRLLHWIGDRVVLAGVLNVVAAAMVTSDPEEAARIHGSVRSVVMDRTPASPPEATTDHTGPATATAEGFVIQLRRRTAERLEEALGEPRSRELRTEGAAIPYDRVAARVLATIERVTRPSW